MNLESQKFAKTAKIYQQLADKNSMKERRVTSILIASWRISEEREKRRCARRLQLKYTS